MRIVSFTCYNFKCVVHPDANNNLRSAIDFCNYRLGSGSVAFPYLFCFWSVTFCLLTAHRAMINSLKLVLDLLDRLLCVTSCVFNALSTPYPIGLVNLLIRDLVVIDVILRQGLVLLAILICAYQLCTGASRRFAFSLARCTFFGP